MTHEDKQLGTKIEIYNGSEPKPVRFFEVNNQIIFPIHNSMSHELLAASKLYLENSRILTR